MPYVVTPITVRAATGLPLGVDGVDGVCEKAAVFEVEAREEARARFGGAAYDDLAEDIVGALDGYDGGTAAQQDRYDRWVRALSLLCMAAALPSLNQRPVPTGGFVTETGGPESRQVLMSQTQSVAAANDYRRRAQSFLDRLAVEVAADLGEPDPTPIIHFG